MTNDDSQSYSDDARFSPSRTCTWGGADGEMSWHCFPRPFCKNLRYASSIESTQVAYVTVEALLLTLFMELSWHL